MTDKQKYWIHDVEGVYAQVEGAEARDEWTKVRGWTEADEPGPTDQVHVINENPEIAQGHPLPYAALEGWVGLGFSAGPPPQPYGTTKPAPPTEQPAEPTKSTKAAATAAGEQKEK
jgi:hypothetical protein